MELLDEERLRLRHQSVISCLGRVEERLGGIDKTGFIAEVIPRQVLLNVSVLCTQHLPGVDRLSQYRVQFITSFNPR